MKKWEGPVLMNLRIDDTKNICNPRAVTGWFICDKGHCFHLEFAHGEIKCPECGSKNCFTYCPPCS